MSETIKLKRLTQKDRVLKYMQDFGGITSFEAFEDIGATRLSAIIFELRKEYNIESESKTSRNRYGDKVSYFNYYLVDDKK